MKVLSRFAVYSFCSLAALGASAQYTPVLLHPFVGDSYSLGRGISTGQQVGYGNSGQGDRALLWEGSSGSFVSLHPAGYSASAAHGAHNGRQGGVALQAGSNQARAIIWNGSANDFIDVHSSIIGGINMISSGIGAMGGDQQVGAALPTGKHSDIHAVLWHGTAQSAVLLHPQGYNGSAALATDGLQQVGWGTPVGGSGERALLWTGTAESVVDLTPASVAFAIAHGVANGQQVGNIGGIGAVIWHGTSDYVSLNPGPEWASVAYATNGHRQVGYYGFASATRAAVWSGSAASMIDLHALLPTEWGAIRSEARGIDEMGNIIGTVLTPPGSRAVMWVVPEPGTIAALAAGIGLLLARRRKK